MRTVLAKCWVKVLAAKPSSVYMTHMKERENGLPQIDTHTHTTHILKWNFFWHI